MAEPLSDDEIEAQLPDGWEYDGEEIHRTFEFDDYLRGVNFALTVGEIAEHEFHHPTMTIGYKTLEVRFHTHEADGVTEQDLEMAAIVNGEAEGIGDGEDL